VTLRYVLVFSDDALLGLYSKQPRSSSGGGSMASSTGGGSDGLHNGSAPRALRAGGVVGVAAVSSTWRHLHAANACWTLTLLYGCFMLLLAAWRWLK
jgi:hypothetical protein